MPEQSPEITFKGFPIKTDDSLKADEFYMINTKCMNPKHPLYKVLHYFLNYYEKLNDRTIY